MMLLDSMEQTFKKRNSVAGITLNLQPGEIFGILSAAGTSKSTLIRSINLLDTHGTILHSYDLTSLTTEALRRVRCEIGMIFQHFNLLKSRSVFDNVALPLEFLHTPKNKIEAVVQPLLELTQLVDKSHVYPYELSAEEKQRVSIARALVTQPKILFCEEATAALDFKSKQPILQLLNTINQELKINIILITHELEAIKSISHRMTVLHQGEVVEFGTVADIYSHPTSEVTKNFIKTAALAEIPAFLKKRLCSTYRDNASLILRITFRGALTNDPLIALILHRFNLSVNIIQAHLESMQNDKVGVMIAELIGNKVEIDNAMDYLKEKNLYIEVLGYAL